MGVSRKKRRSRLRKHRTRTKLGASKRRDLISNLPDEVLGRILSYVPTKYAVATSILSSKWKNLYKLTTSLDFDDSVTFRKCFDNGKKQHKFRNFVYKILAQCKGLHISKFRLKCGDKMRRVFHDWVSDILVHKLAELELSIKIMMPTQLKLCSLSCDNLVVLKLDFEFIVLCVPCSVTFPNLKVLSLRGVRLYKTESSSSYHGLNAILSRCPLLEELVIDGCKWRGCLCFTNPLLRKLTLDCGTTRRSNQSYGGTISMNLPNLVQLNYLNCLAVHHEITNLNSIIDAQLDICYHDGEFEDQLAFCNAVLDLIRGVCGCQTLLLSSHCRECSCWKGLTSDLIELPIFHNLTQLHLALGHDVSWNDVLLDFLTSSPCLESLNLVQDFLSWSSIQPDWDLLIEDEEDVFLKNKAVPSCVKSRLKFIKIKEFRGFRGEVQRIMYFLENAGVLEQMVIQWDERKRTQNAVAIQEEILELPKSSVSCTISFE